MTKTTLLHEETLSIKLMALGFAIFVWVFGILYGIYGIVVCAIEFVSYIPKNTFYYIKDLFWD